LYYLLQPPLETLVSSARLTFPFEPFPSQMEGIGFLFSRGAAILADALGLGKTMQAITTIRMLVMAGEIGKVLLVCPKPLVTNWVREFRLWAPEIPLAVIEGDAAKRNWIWQQATTPVKIANYELMMRDWEAMQESGVQFDLMVLDEAQRIKNRNSSTSSIIRSVPRQRSWALTGTPIENSSDDLVSIFEFLSPGFLHDGMSLREMGEATGDFILRRTKDKVLTEMPPKMYRDAMLELTGDQWASYKSAEEEGVIQLSDMGDALTIQHVFELVLRLKQICNVDPLTSSSAKLERLEADLEEVAASGQKAIVFSQWVDTLDKISDRLQRFHPLHYHGRVPSNTRDAVIERFRSDPKCHVILMSYGAGAVGLNLQFCRYVFLFDRWWNPAVEDQAINRAHRLGAAGTVTITRMTSIQTIEQRIHHVLEEKRSLAETLFAEGNGPANLGLTSEESFGLFRVKRPARAA
ncbi:MAG: DEAD/DEAH box helicase, partial [Pirellulaceae bacterium]